ncbi:Hypothetical protein NTJ_07030 [Nesidiocoris tenuis]|uniref:Uncharacterized protein n=1 Tax=Nesidiocoris tenuis TaxID=355587 RepID=A0ABN7APS3_9HEMI|nr:Hypothetical protein NTJ_07030 [Nesidiocoris tenuis]
MEKANNSLRSNKTEPRRIFILPSRPSRPPASSASFPLPARNRPPRAIQAWDAERHYEYELTAGTSLGSPRPYKGSASIPMAVSCKKREKPNRLQPSNFNLRPRLVRPYS